MATPILVTGGTGNLGRLVVSQLLDGGQAVRVLSRTPSKNPADAEYLTGDLDTGVGIDTAVDGAEIVIHCAGSQQGDEVKALHLARAAKRAGVQHLVNISVVGADRVRVASRADRAMFGYFASKRGAEKVVEDSGVPWTTLRATQFHDLMFTVVQAMGRLPVVPAPSGFRFQPVDAAEVAARLVELALGAPAGLVPDLGGPEVFELRDLVGSYLRQNGRRRPILPIPLPGKGAQDIRAGAILARDGAVGHRTWEQFLVSTGAGR